MTLLGTGTRSPHQPQTTIFAGDMPQRKTYIQERISSLLVNYVAMKCRCNASLRIEEKECSDANHKRCLK